MPDVKTKSFPAINPNGDLTRGEFGGVIEKVHVLLEDHSRFEKGDILVWDSTFGWMADGHSYASEEAKEFADTLI